jgi:hypothetical protein
MGYKILGYAVWQVGRWYVRRRFAAMLPSRRVIAGALAVTAIGATAIVAAHRSSDS